MADMILICFGGICLLLSVYGLIKILIDTQVRNCLMDAVGGEILAYISMIAWVLVVIGGSAFLIFKGIDAEAAKSFRIYVHSFQSTHFLEGALCLFLTYGFSKLNNVERGAKRTLIIVAGILFGLIAIFFGANR